MMFVEFYTIWIAHLALRESPNEIKLQFIRRELINGCQRSAALY